ncbi:MAG: restriction endonuclease subunit S [Lachnospiraceae bacterium]|nr:restriction endonuclease subunit S [Lachnospiraceae bacterium]
MGNPKIRFKGYTDDWEQHRLEEICTYYSSTLTAKDIDEDGIYNLYDANSLIGKTNKGYMAEDYITIIKDGAGVGRTRLLPKFTMFLGTMGAMIPQNSDLNFLFQLITKADLGKEYTGSTIPHIYFKDYGKNKYYVPCCYEEQRILGIYFSHIDHLLTFQQCKCDEVKQLKKYMLQKMFPQNGADIPEIRFNGFTEAWEQRRVTDILKNGSAAMKIGPFGSALKKEFFVEKGIKVYAQENIFSRDFNIGEYYITEEKFNELKSCELFPGDLVISMMGTIGACAIFPETAEKGIMNSHLLRLQFNKNVIPEYIMFLLRDTQQIKIQIDRLSVGSIMSGLSSSVVKKLVFPVPIIEEQKQIVNFLKHLDNLITLHQRKCNELQNIKKFMLQNMFV